MDVAAHVHPAPPPSAASATCISRLYTDERAWALLRDHWDRLLAESLDATPWQSWTYQSCWWAHLAEDRELRIVTVEQHREPRLILPLQLRKQRIAGISLRCLEPIGMPDDINRPRLTIGPLQPEAWRAAMGRIWNMRAEWDLLQLDERPLRDPEIERLGRFALAHGLRLRTVPLHPCPLLRLDQGWEQYLRTRSTRLRKTLRNALHRLEALGRVRLLRFEGADVARGYELMLQVQARSWKQAARLGLSRSEASSQFHRSLLCEMALKDRARVLVLFCNETPVAATLALTEGRRYYSAAIAHDEAFAPCSPGTLLERFELEQLMKEGRFETYDFLGAALTNKLRWTDTVRETCRVWLLNPSPRTQLVDALYFRVKPAVRSLRIRVEDQVRALRTLGVEAHWREWLASLRRRMPRS